MTEDSLARALTEWADDSRLERARSQRSTQRWNEQAAAESSTFAGLLIDLYETATPVQVSVLHERKHGGQVVEVGRDFVAIAAPNQARILIPLDCVGSVQLAADTRSLGTISDRASDAGAPFDDVLVELAAERIHVRFVTRTSAQVRSGTLVSVGADVVTIALDSPTETVFVPVNQLAEVSVG